VRSTICTSLALCLSTGPAISEPSFGCYATAYDERYLSLFPDRVVSSIRLSLAPNSGAAGNEPSIPDAIARIDVILADQGHAARAGLGGQAMFETFNCTGTSDLSCEDECNRPDNPDIYSGILIHGGGPTIAIRVDSQLVGQGQACEGLADISDGPGEPTNFFLDRVDDAYCDQN
jgi:hypothetical protein